MAVLDQMTYPHAKQPSVLSIYAYKAVAFCEGITFSLRRHVASARTASTLSALSDRQLSDIGVERADIHMISEQLAERMPR